MLTKTMPNKETGRYTWSKSWWQISCSV